MLAAPLVGQVWFSAPPYLAAAEPRDKFILLFFLDRRRRRRRRHPNGCPNSIEPSLGESMFTFVCEWHSKMESDRDDLYGELCVLRPESEPE